MATTEEEYGDIKQQCITTFTWQEADVPAFPPNNRNEFRNRGAQGGGDSGGDGRVCYNCGATDHLQRDCPQGRMGKGKGEGKGEY